MKKTRKAEVTYQNVYYVGKKQSEDLYENVKINVDTSFNSDLALNDSYFVVKEGKNRFKLCLSWKHVGWIQNSDGGIIEDVNQLPQCINFQKKHNGLNFNNAKVEITKEEYEKLKYEKEEKEKKLKKERMERRRKEEEKETIEKKKRILKAKKNGLYVDLNN